MEIIDARWETSEEKEIRFSKFKNVNKKNLSLNWCETNTQYLIDKYNSFINVYIDLLFEKKLTSIQKHNESLESNNEFIESVKSGETHLCQCGSKLRYITYYNFVGCSNYNDLSFKHDTYKVKLKFTEPAKENLEIPKTYLLEFRKYAKIPDYVQESIIYKTLLMNDCKIIANIDSSKYNIAPIASKDSKIEEGIILNKLKSKYKSVLVQQGIKVYDGFNWFTKIPDYICFSNPQEIFVYDAKKAIRNIDTTQLNIYVDAIRLISKDSASVTGYFIIADREDYTNEYLLNYNCFTITML
jgi:ssDNA-binding Zn-finger/Zn-ribbon topoisomerase 1